MKKSMLFVLIALLGMPMAAMAAITGDCAGCHTMHNSEENAPVAMTGIGASTPLESPEYAIPNLLRFDCIACHAQNTDKIVELNGSDIPQVYHDDTTGDLAGGNFKHIANAITAADPNANRKGHNVIDLFPGGDDTGGAYTRPPGFTNPDTGDHNNVFSTDTDDFGKFTCAGAAGCHGTRNQKMVDGSLREGMAAISGAHHQSVDGKRDPAQNTAIAHDGALVAQGYRFIPGLKGIGNNDPLYPWQNYDMDSHNEYYGNAAELGSSCGACHVGGSSKGETSQLKVPNQSMSGFCSTCHGDFHSMGSENGSSGAFLRHPSDYVLPGAGTEYAGYTEYNVSAPVARSTSFFGGLTGPDSTVSGEGGNGDMVMCLSCHVAHASKYDGMLRFDYAEMAAGGTAADNGCLACHTNK